MEHPPTYLILGTARSGGTLLCQAMAGTGVAGDPKEFFGARMSYWMKRWRTPTPRRFARRLIAERSTPNGVFGAKLLWSHLLHLERRCRTRRRYAELPLAEILADLFPNLHYVRIERDDKVRQAVSYWKASESGVWGQSGTRRTKTVKAATFDAAGIETMLRRIETEEAAIDTEEAAIDRFFADGAIEPFRVVYEELAAAYEPTTRAVLRFLGLPDADGAELRDPRTQKLADDETEEWVARFRRMQADGGPDGPENAPWYHPPTT